MDSERNVQHNEHRVDRMEQMDTECDQEHSLLSQRQRLSMQERAVHSHLLRIAMCLSIHGRFGLLTVVSVKCDLAVLVRGRGAGERATSSWLHAPTPCLGQQVRRAEAFIAMQSFIIILLFIVALR